MITKVENINNVNSIQTRHNKKEGKSPAFKGLGGLALAGIQACERMPMVNVAVIDMLSAILPRTVVESLTNWFAGFEAFRRESSGLIVNCMIPSGIAYLFALMLNPIIMPKGANLANCWADRAVIDKISTYYKNAQSDDKIFESIKNILENIEGVHGDKKVLFKDALSKEELEKYAHELTEISLHKNKNGKDVSAIVDKIVEKTHISEHITIGKDVKTASVKSTLSDTVKFFRAFDRSKNHQIEAFAEKAKTLVISKSLLGLAVILPLAISMQYINRWITGKVSGVKGAPIYEDFGKEKDNIEENPKAKEGLLRQKLISISSMVGVALLSMMKKPTMGMLEFKGKFPTMDQARIISTSTFSSRMAAADDKNELAESTIRDIATFCGLYFFGDYAAKAMATILQKKTGVMLLNDTKPISKDASILKKFTHWVKDVNVKSSEEVISKTKEMLKDAKPTNEQLKQIEKELDYAKKLRAGCQYTNIGVSLILLGIIIPIFTRLNTKRKHEKALKLAEEQNKLQPNNKKEEPPVTPLNVDYNKLTAGFRSMKKSA